MEDWSSKTVEQLFGTVGEMPGSPASYWRDVEIKRRTFNQQQSLLICQVKALEEQQKATRVQREAIAEQRESTKQMTRQANLMFWSVIGIFATAVVTLIAAFV